MGLDIQAARTVKALVKGLAQDKGKTVVLTTHQLDMAQELCQQIAIISKGRIIADQPVEELLDLFEENYYQIILQGNREVSAEFPGMDRTRESGNTVLTGSITGQDDLYALLNKDPCTGPYIDLRKQNRTGFGRSIYAPASTGTQPVSWRCRHENRDHYLDG